MYLAVCLSIRGLAEDFISFIVEYDIAFPRLFSFNKSELYFLALVAVNPEVIDSIHNQDKSLCDENNHLYYICV